MRYFNGQFNRDRRKMLIYTHPPKEVFNPPPVKLTAKKRAEFELMLYNLFYPLVHTGVLNHQLVSAFYEIIEWTGEPHPEKMLGEWFRYAQKPLQRFFSPTLDKPLDISLQGFDKDKRIIFNDKGLCFKLIWTNVQLVIKPPEIMKIFKTNLMIKDLLLSLQEYGRAKMMYVLETSIWILFGSKLPIKVIDGGNSTK